MEIKGGYLPGDPTLDFTKTADGYRWQLFKKVAGFSGYLHLMEARLVNSN